MQLSESVVHLSFMFGFTQFLVILEFSVLIFSYFRFVPFILDLDGKIKVVLLILCDHVHQLSLLFSHCIYTIMISLLIFRHSNL